MKRVFVFAASVVTGIALFGDSACTGPFPSNPSSERLEVTIQAGSPTSSPTARIPLSFTTPETYTITVRALHADGTVDTGFNGYVRLSSEPGSVQAVSGPNTNGRNVQLQSGVAENVNVAVLAAYGNTFIRADDVGYVPADPARVCTAGSPCPSRCKVGEACPPACANGIDDNDNGLIDYPTEIGCYLANDDTEDGGTYSAGISPPIYYYIPRIADIRGGPEGGTGTPFPSQAVNVNCGYLGENNYDFSVVVTRVSSSGFYVTDIDEDSSSSGFGSVFAYNFSAPPNMRQCDRLRSFGGTTSDFYGFTEVNYPTWELEEWDPSQRPCLVPEPHTLAPSCTPSGSGPALANCVTIPASGENTTQMLSVAAALVRLQYSNGVPTSAKPATAAGAGTIFHIGSLIGEGYPCGPVTCAGCCTSEGTCDPKGSPTATTCDGTPAPAAYTPTANATNCDLDNSGKVDRTDPDELACANACEANPECSEYTNYSSENQFNLVAQTVTWNAGDSAPTVTATVAIQGDGSSDPTFSPLLLKGQTLGSFTGTLYYFSGGSQYTIQARCADDIVPLGQPPVPSDTACVHARTILDTSSGSN